MVSQITSEWKISLLWRRLLIWISSSERIVYLLLHVLHILLIDSFGVIRIPLSRLVIHPVISIVISVFASTLTWLLNDSIFIDWHWTSIVFLLLPLIQLVKLLFQRVSLLPLLICFSILLLLLVLLILFRIVKGLCCVVSSAIVILVCLILSIIFISA